METSLPKFLKTRIKIAVVYWKATTFQVHCSMLHANDRSKTKRNKQQLKDGLGLMGRYEHEHYYYYIMLHFLDRITALWVYKGISFFLGDTWKGIKGTKMSAS